MVRLRKRVPFALIGVLAIALIALAGCPDLLGGGGPKADAGGDQTVTVGTVVTLDGRNSQGANSYTWQIVDKPAGSAATLSSSRNARVTFTADLPGDYTITLTVRNDNGTDTTTVIITATGGGGGQTITLSGTLTVDPSITGSPTIYVGILTSLPTGTVTTIPWATGISPNPKSYPYGSSVSFSFTGVPTGSYFIGAFADTDFDGQYDNIEPSGGYPTNQSGPFLQSFQSSATNITFPITSPNMITGVSVTPSSTTILSGSSQTLYASISPSSASYSSISWSTSNPGVASISPLGTTCTVTGGTAGYATITVSVNGTYNASASVAVSSSITLVSGVSIYPTSATILVGGTQSFSAYVIPANATDQNISFSSNDPSVASVNATTGVVTGVSAGSATITARNPSSGHSQNATVTVFSSTIPVTGVSVTPTSATIPVGQSQSLSAIVTPASASNTSVTWTSSNTAVATVNSQGVVTGVSEGSATITVRSVGNSSYFASSAITVTSVHVSSVSLNMSQANLVVGSTLTLTAYISPSNAANQNVTWFSSDNTKATVSSSGVVSGVSAGSATIRATAVDGNISASCYITIYGTQVSVTGVSLNTPSLSLTAGGTYGLVATIYPTNATNQNVTWTSSNTGIATVGSTGIVTAVAAGNAYITVTTANGAYSASASVSVLSAAVRVTGVTLSPMQTTVMVGGFQYLYVYISPPSATDQAVSWSSTNTSIVSINQGGMITGVSAGSAYVTVTTHDGSFMQYCWVTVTSSQIPVTGIQLSLSTATISVGGSQNLYAYITPSTATNTNVYWSSSNPAIASVSTSGLVYGLVAGTANITATTADGGYYQSCAVTVGAGGGTIGVVVQ